MGNYNFGIKEQIIFTEINYDDIDSVRGLNVTISTTAKPTMMSILAVKRIWFSFDR